MTQMHTTAVPASDELVRTRSRFWSDTNAAILHASLEPDSVAEGQEHEPPVAQFIHDQLEQMECCRAISLLTPGNTSLTEFDVLVVIVTPTGFRSLFADLRVAVTSSVPILPVFYDPQNSPLDVSALRDGAPTDVFEIIFDQEIMMLRWDFEWERAAFVSELAKRLYLLSSASVQ